MNEPVHNVVPTNDPKDDPAPPEGFDEYIDEHFPHMRRTGTMSIDLALSIAEACYAEALQTGQAHVADVPYEELEAQNRQLKDLTRRQAGRIEELDQHQQELEREVSRRQDVPHILDTLRVINSQNRNAYLMRERKLVFRCLEAIKELEHNVHDLDDAQDIASHMLVMLARAVKDQDD